MPESWTPPVIVDHCREAALALLRANMVADGVLAATPSRRAQQKSYHAVFARDAAICALAMLRSGEPLLVEGARHGLEFLARHQADNGQIPKFVLPAKADADFWYVGCIDATLWWLIALRHFSRHLPAQWLERRLGAQIGRAIQWLQCQEHPRLALLTQNEASDWADIMPRSGFVLYTNALWYYVKRLYALPRAAETRHHFNHLFFPFAGELPEYRRLRLLGHFVRNRAKARELYLSFVNFSFWGEEGDVFGNLLAILLGLASGPRARSILRALRAGKVDEPWPVRATVTPIEADSPLWRVYMERHRQNLAWQYHNGGAWPMVGGFWVMALAALGETVAARQALVRLAEANAVNGFEFNEWFHGRTGEPMGMAGQSWSAAAFLLAQGALGGRIF
ncbi:MAG TPA: glycoside hydrolase 100 family protein [Pelomicrobium sp.]|nr:glycoside hydrolase 100 family protein [Pelomicrobium sp.]